MHPNPASLPEPASLAQALEEHPGVAVVARSHGKLPFSTANKCGKMLVEAGTIVESG